MNKKILIIILMFFVIIICIGIIVAGFIYIPKLLNNNQDNNDKVCEITNCHGLDIQCGSNPPEMCTEIFEIGDNCRQFASCKIDGSTCTFKPSNEFSQCKSCVEECKSKYTKSNEIPQEFSCAEKCSDIESKSVGNTTTISNPSASYCTNIGFNYDQESDLCIFDEEKSCDAWDFYRGKCMKENTYCEQRGYELSNVREITSTSEYEYALCKFNDDTVCAEEEFYRGQCVVGQCREWIIEQGGCVKIN